MRILLFYSLLLLLPALLIHAAGVTMVEVLSGKVVPLTMTVKELNGEWRILRYGAQRDDAAALTRLMISSSLVDPSQYLTKGQMLVIESETYLVAYRDTSEPVDFRALAARGGPPLSMLPQHDSTLALSLLNMRQCRSVSDIRPFDPAVFRQQERRAKEATLQANLHQLRCATEQFNADTGAYPLRLSDLLLPKHQAPKQGISERGASITIPADAYMGPYLSRRGGIAEAPGIPCNPFVDLVAANPDPKNVATHWKYVNGVVTVPDAMANEKTVDEGCTYGEL